jgi:RHS repeat-associated protein
VYDYTYDAMGRLNGMTHVDAETNWTVTDVGNVLYGPGGQLLQMWYSIGWQSGTEIRTYNPRLQLTRITWGSWVDLEYRYSATQNDGRITQMKNWKSGEEVTYQYDALQRLMSAATTGPEWGLSFSYDGFGNRTGQNVTKGSAPVMNLTYDGLTNRIGTQHGFGYDASGNTVTMPGKSMTYDYYNRLTKVVMGSATMHYRYAPSNKRVHRKEVPEGSSVNEEFYFWGVDGNQLGSYRICTEYHNGHQLYFCQSTTEKYFGRRRLGVVEDRIGSAANAGPYFPYGEQSNHYATHRKDVDTGLHYADQRYYSSIQGRFLTPDPYQASAELPHPGTWNQYAYVLDDPVNLVDSTGETPEHLAGGFYGVAYYFRAFSAFSEVEHTAASIHGPTT